MDIKITKEYEGLRRVENGDYVIESDLIVDGKLEIELDDRLVVKGKIEAKKSIISQGTIIAGDGIKAGCGIEAGDGIKAKTFILCKKRIFAGISIYNTTNDCDKTIRCAVLKEGEIAYGELIIEKQSVKMTIAEIEKKLGIEI